MDLPPTPRQAEEQTVPVEMPKRQAWINPPGLQLVLQRGLVNSSEQRLLLRNNSAVGGDNLMILRTRKAPGPVGRLQFREFARRVGGLPAPFEDLATGELITASDDLGPYFWAERRSGVDTVCILAIRRLDTADRQLPEDVDAMDILLRNCVRGAPEAALTPILAGAVGASAEGAPGPGKSRMLSALAGPLPE